MIVTYNKSVLKVLVPKIESGIGKGLNYLAMRYPHFDFSDAKLKISATRNGSNFWQEDEVVNISTRPQLYLYAKANAGLTTPKSGLYVGTETQVACSVVHELTHYVQKKEGRKYSEVETTRNEIDYLRMNCPDDYRNLIVVETV